MDLFIPTNLKQQLLAFGPEGTAWLNNLPNQIAKLEQTWGFRTGTAFDHGGAVSWVAPVEREDGPEAVLKIGFPHEEARFEAEALRFLDGHNAVRLLYASDDGFALLLEHCLPGHDLWSLPEAEADAVACQLLPGIWRTPLPNAPFQPVAECVAGWWEGALHPPGTGDYDTALIAKAIKRSQELIASQPPNVLLHGDFHPGNVLAAQREPWLIIDPKPLVGDPAYDIAQWLLNRYAAARQSGDPVTVLRKQIDFFATNLGLSPARIAGWTFVKALGWESAPDVVACFHEVAHYKLPTSPSA